jgi:hypothetical protein
MNRMVAQKNFPFLTSINYIINQCLIKTYTLLFYFNFPCFEKICLNLKFLYYFDQQNLIKLYHSVDQYSCLHLECLPNFLPQSLKNLIKNRNFIFDLKFES